MLHCRSQCVKGVEKALDRTKNNTGMILNIALNYGSRREIVRAVRIIAEKSLNNEINPADIDEDLIGSLLYTQNIPDPDLLIRTAGEMRISNFMLWQVAYTELFITPVMWPDFDRPILMQAIWSYQQRERRFGGLK